MYTVYSKTCENGHSKIDKIKILTKNGSLVRAKVFLNAPHVAFCNTSDLHEGIIGLENQFWVFFSGGRLKFFLTFNNLLESKTNISLCTDLIFTDHLFIC